MKWHEIPDGSRVFEVVVQVEDWARDELAIPNLEVSCNLAGQWFVTGNGPPVSAQPIGKNAIDVLRVVAGNPDRHLSHGFADGKNLRIETRIFSGSVRLDSTLRLILPPEYAAKLPAAARMRLDMWFQETFAWDGTFFVHSGGQAFDVTRDFEIRGLDWKIGLRALGDRLVVSHVGRWKRSADLVRLEAPVALVPEQYEIAATALEFEGRVAFDESEFLDVWARYQEAERRILEDRAKRLGQLRYTSRYYDKAMVVFELEADVPEAWKVEDDRFTLAAADAGRSVAVGKIVKLEARSVVAESPEGALPPTGTISPDELGDRKRLARRDTALGRLRSGDTSLPDLLSVLEGHGRTAIVGKLARWASPGVIDALGERTLTPAQARAVEIALNSPDVALIQGPPGTGKTTVIRILAQRLHELGRGPVLLTSYQHEAVLRAVEGVMVGGVPAVRVGGRRGEDPGLALRPLGEWLARVRTCTGNTFENAGIEPAWRALSRRIGRAYGGWCLDPGGTEGTRTLLAEFRRILGGHLPGEMVTRLEAAEHALTPAPTPVALDDITREQLLRLVEQQARSPEAFADGGDLKVRRLLASLRGKPLQLDDETLRVLEAGTCEADSPPGGFDGALENVRRALAPSLPAPEHDPVSDVRPHLDAIVDWVQKETARRGGRLKDALQVFLDQLEERGVSLPILLGRYAPAIGATLQQSVIEAMSDLHPIFDTVIVDEAARANPLDLLIPLVVARRIVLVGDQNQLPHMLEPELEQAVEVGAAGSAAAILRESLFGRLWSMYESAPPGGIPRTERLDVQFRMHPRIGRFISDTFYGGALTDGVGVADREHGTTLFDGHPVAWFDVKGATEAGRYSRVVEIDRAAELVRAIADASPTSSIGVITFYKRQAELLSERSRALGWPDNVEVGTVDAFQGKEFDFVILSTVRSGGGVGFLRLPNRLNVAMSRGRRALVVVGDASTVRQVAQLDRFFELCRTEGYCVRA
jgi:hypothetical protein